VESEAMADDAQIPQTLKAAVGDAVKSKTAIISVIMTFALSAIGAAWSGLERIAAWGGQHADAVIKTHIDSVKNTDSAVEKLTEATTTIAGTQKELAEGQKQQGKAIDGIHETLKSLDGNVKGILQTQESIGATLKRLPAKPDGSE
jgi:hypothetical protein